MAPLTRAMRAMAATDIFIGFSESRAGERMIARTADALRRLGGKFSAYSITPIW
jgi:hypothetical protein